MEKLEMLQAKRDEILDKINNHNHEVALLREELDNVQYRIGIQRLLREKGDLLKDEKIKEGIEWISIAQMIEGLEKKWEAVSRPSPCCEKPFEKYAKKLNEEREKEQEKEISRLKEELKLKGELKPSPAYYSHEQEIEKLREENEGLKAQLKEAMAELRQMQRERAAEAIQMIHRNSMWPSPFPRF